MGIEDDHESEELEARPPTAEDLAALCRELNERGARYIVIGGLAIRGAGYLRETVDVDLLIDTSPENESRVFSAMMTLPDQAIREVKPGEVAHYTVVRVGDEIVVDLMKSACGIDYAQAAHEIIVREIQGVPIPFASPRLLWRMKSRTHREKDIPDLLFLKEWFAQRGETPPE